MSATRSGFPGGRELRSGLPVLGPKGHCDFT